MQNLFELAANPSGFDSYANYMGEKPDLVWLVVLTRSRDSDCLTESNWACALSALGGESENVEIFRFGHWACGWWEALCVREGSKEEKIGEGIESSLSDYPILDESDFSEREQEEANGIWRDCYSWRQRVKYIREHSSQFEFYDFKDMLACARGNYFSGYASELIA